MTLTLNTVVVIVAEYIVRSRSQNDTKSNTSKTCNEYELFHFQNVHDLELSLDLDLKLNFNFVPLLNI